MYRIIASCAIACIASVGCTAEMSSPTQAPTTAPVTSASTTTGRILFVRYSPTGVAEHFVANTDGSDEQAFLPGEEFEVRQLSLTRPGSRSSGRTRMGS